ncbi:uncharacterized protein LOC110715249 [Chenopodium quinoa]|uniref:uncharacterized protein LOC110715249 n=1 Tax=Chenopodium quinoa TaxID=63459 RepID=UPI000B78C1E8|nr:uncharacterized protein LOC110715249 [Chenopodium quinoa]
MVDPRTKSLLEYGIPDTTTGFLSSIVRPPVTAQSFELKPQFIQFISNDSFAGSSNNCPVTHIDSFLEKCDTMKLNGVTDDAIRLRLFPFSLRDRAREWLRDEGIGSFDTWDKLAKAFLVKFLGQEKIAKLRNELSTFHQSNDESLYEAWRRFKRLQRQFPHHGIPEWMLIQTFYNGLTHEFCIYIDAVSRGSIMTKNPTDVRDLIEKMAANDNYHPRGRNAINTGNKHDVDALTMLNSSVQALTHKVNQFQAESPRPSMETCQMCGLQGHTTRECQPNYDGMTIEQDNAFYTTTSTRPFDEGWRNHQGFSYKNTQAIANPPPPPAFQARAPFNHHPMHQPPPQSSNLESIMETFATSQRQQQELISKQFDLQAKQNEYFENSIQLLVAQNKRIETHISQLSQQVSHLSTLQDQAKVQTKQCNAIFVKSDDLFTGGLEEKVCNVESKTEKHEREGPKHVALQAYEEPMPFPQRLSKVVLDKHFGKYSETLKKVYATIPFSDLVVQMPQFANFVKGIIDHDHNDKKLESVVVKKKCSDLLHDSLPPKLHDPGSFTIPCMINKTYFDRVLCDLGASVNLMPSSVYEKLGLKKFKPSPISLHMANRTVRLPKGVVEDVLVGIGELVFPVDFVVVDIKEDHKIPLIFGRPFLATSQALIDVPKGQVTIRAQDKQVVFKLFNDHNFTFDGGTCMN